MRISTNLLFNTGLKTIGTQQADLMHLYQQIGSGQRMVTPADDPLAAAQSINIAQSQSLTQRFTENRAVATRNLAAEEDALGSLTNLLVDVRTRVVEAGNGTLSDTDRRTLSQVLSGAREAMLALANTTDGSGQYLFSGSRGQTPAYTDAGTYAGDGLQRQIQADQTRRIASGDVGRDIFERAQPGTLAYGSQQQAQGTGSTAIVGLPRVVDGTQGNADAHLGFTVTFTSSTTYDLTVTDYSVAGGGASETFTGEVFVPGSTVLNLQQSDGGAPPALIPAGTQLQISGDPAAGDVFTVTPQQHDDTFNLFNTLDTLIKALDKPVSGTVGGPASLRNALNTAMQQLETGYDNVLTVRSSIGARMNELDAMDDVGAQQKLGYTKDLSRLEDLDYYDATMKLNLRKMALEGASLAFQTIQGLSLFNIGGGR